LKSMDAGTTLEVVSTDPGSVADFAAFCRTTGNEMLEQTEGDGIWTYLIRKT
jgi:tRNA 2-thiouridine synthesizing protein A